MYAADAIAFAAFVLIGKTMGLSYMGLKFLVRNCENVPGAAGAAAGAAPVLLLLLLLLPHVLVFITEFQGVLRAPVEVRD